VISRYTAYRANQVMTTTAATSMISKKSTTSLSLVPQRCPDTSGHPLIG
jgi:hypothetical protein